MELKPPLIRGDLTLIQMTTAENILFPNKVTFWCSRWTWTWGGWGGTHHELIGSWWLCSSPGHRPRHEVACRAELWKAASHSLWSMPSCPVHPPPSCLSGNMCFLSTAGHDQEASSLWRGVSRSRCGLLDRFLSIVHLPSFKQRSWEPTIPLLSTRSSQLAFYEVEKSICIFLPSSPPPCLFWGKKKVIMLQC